MFIRTISLVGLALSLSACALDEKLTGYAQKGPFKEGASVYLYSLDYDGDHNGYDDDDKQISNSEGKFSFKGIPSGWIELSVSGRYFNEYTGDYSDHSLSLDAVVDKEIFNDRANINLFTHLAAARTFERVHDGKTLYKGWRTAQSNLKSVFGLKRVSDDEDRGAEKLSVTDGESNYREDNANLLLFTGGFLAIGGDATKLLLLSDDFADDGIFNGVGKATFDEIADAASEAGLLAKLSQNLKDHGATNPPDDEDLPELPNWVR